MRHKYLVISRVRQSAVRAARFHRGPARPGGEAAPVIVTSPLLFSGYYNPYYLGFGQWYPTPIRFGYPPGPASTLGPLQQRSPPGLAARSVRLRRRLRRRVVDDYDGVFQRLQLVPGHHEIVVYHQGYRTLRQNLY